jgi:hypothetical protein
VTANLALPYPVGASNEALRAAVVRLIDVIKTIKTDADQQNALDALAIDVANISTAVSNQTATLEELQLNELTPQERFEIALDHALDTVQGSRAEFESWITNQMMQVVDMALSVRRDTTDNTTRIVEQQVVRVSESEAFAQRINTVEADLSSTNATVSSIATAYVTGDQALADQIDTVSTTVAGNTTSISTMSTSIDGISAQWVLQVSTNGNVIGSATMTGSQNTSSFNVVADRFSFAMSDNGPAVPFFTSGSVGGIPTSVFTGTLIGDGTIIGRHILAGEVTASKISAGAVTAEKLDVTELSAVSGDMGTLTFGKIQSTDGKFLIDATTKQITIVS